MRSILGDVRLAFRSFSRHPLLYGVAVLSLSVGIGANAAIFSLLDAVVFRPLPYDDPGALMRVWSTDEEKGFTYALSLPDAIDLREGAASLDLAAHRSASFNVVANGEPRLVRGRRAT